MANDRQKRFRPWLPVEAQADNKPPTSSLSIRKCDLAAIQSLSHGVADKNQQQMAWNAILHICGINDADWMPDEHGGDRETSFAAGKRHVGLQLRKLTSFSLNLLTGEQNDRTDQ